MKENKEYVDLLKSVLEVSKIVHDHGRMFINSIKAISKKLEELENRIKKLENKGC